jgi:hypothetical protein
VLVSDRDQVMGILAQAKRLAQQYREVTGKPLGITGEVAEFEAARILGLELTPARTAGYDAIERSQRARRAGRDQVQGDRPPPLVTRRGQ